MHSSPVPHARVSEALNEGDKWLKLLNLSLNVLRHCQTPGNTMKMFDTLVHGLEGTVDVRPEQLGVDVDERVIHPRVVPL